MMETADFITLDISGPELLGLEQYYESNSLDNLIQKIYQDRIREIGGLAIAHEERDLEFGLNHFLRYEPWRG